MKIFIFFSLIHSFVYATTFIAERGTYSFGIEEIKDYYRDNSINYIKFSNDYPSSQFKINENNRFQIKNWFSRDWHSLQKMTQTEPLKYIEYHQARSFNEAKLISYRQKTFQKEEMRHIEQTTFLREWGILDHPPFKEKLEDLSLFSKNYNKINYSTIDSAFFDASFQEQLDKISLSELSFNNQIRILEDNSSYLKKLELIRNAKNSILMSSLVCDSSTKVLVEELIKKSKEGLDVFIIADKMISSLLFHNECPKRLKRNGVKVILANDFFKHKGNSIYHNKKLITDLTHAIVGGQNMLNADNLSHGTDFKNRDIDVIVRGPVVQDIANGFIEDYLYFYQRRLKTLFRRTLQRGRRNVVMRSYKRALEKFKLFNIEKIKKKNDQLKELSLKNKLRGSSHYPQVLNDHKRRMKGVCRFINQSPFIDRTNIGNAYLHILDQTKNYLAIQSPQILDSNYSTFKEKPLFEKFDTFTMYNKLFDKIYSLSENRDISIDFITSGPEVAGNENTAMLHEQIKEHISDNKIKAANRKYKQVTFWNDFFGKSHYSNLLNDYAQRENTTIWTHLSYIHSKIFYFDRIIASIGSYNFQHNATDHSYENTLVCQDESLNRQLDEVMVRDMANSIPFVFMGLSQ